MHAGPNMNHAFRYYLILVKVLVDCCVWQLQIRFCWRKNCFTSMTCLMWACLTVFLSAFYHIPITTSAIAWACKQSYIKTYHLKKMTHTWTFKIFPVTYLKSKRIFLPTLVNATSSTARKQYFSWQRVCVFDMADFNSRNQRANSWSKETSRYILVSAEWQNSLVNL